MRFRFDERKTAQAAAHLLKLSGGRLNYMTLIKLLFLADRASLVKNEQPITGSRMVSMDKGPVLSEVLDLITEGSRSDGPWLDYVTPPSNYEVSLRVKEPETDELSKFELRVLEKIHARFGAMDKWALVDWLHANIPEWTDPRGSALSIEYADVLRACDVSKEDIQRIREESELKLAIGSFAK
jgi:uncharacterized phage-associated protein